MNAVEKDILDRFKRKVGERLSLHEMVLFGSRARGDAEPESDMDVLVILDGRVGPVERDVVSECAWEASVEHGMVVASIPVSRKEWEEGPMASSLLAIAVEKEGVVV